MNTALRQRGAVIRFKSVHTALLAVVLLVFTCCCLPNSLALAASGVSSYRGLTPGISTLEDTLRILGRPVSKVYGDDRIICKYRLVQVNIPQKSGIVQFIRIYDPDFRDPNGFHLGSRYTTIRTKLQIEGADNSIVDLEKGIGYIFNTSGQVEQIVYGIIR